MISTNKKMLALILTTAMLALALLAAGCGGNGDSEPSPDNGDDDMPSGSITIASTDFSEPWILAEIAKVLLEENGNLDVTHTRNIQGSTVLHSGMESGDFDLYVSWTGTQFAGVLEKEITDEWRDREKVYDYVKEEFDEEFDAHWFPPLGFDNTYALCVRDAFAEEHDLETISDIREIAPEIEVSMDATFKDRPGDGWEAFLEYYDLEFARGHSMNYGLLYRAVAEEEVDAAIAYSTDGRVSALDLRILEDDKGFFPPYDGALVARNDTLEEFPQIEEVLSVMWDAFDIETMSSLNAQVDVEERDYEDVARDFVEEKGWID